MSIDEEKKFVMKHDFTNLSGVLNGETINGKEEEHFGVVWRMSGEKSRNKWDVYLECLNPCDSDDWSIETTILFGFSRKNITFTKTESKYLMKDFSWNPGLEYIPIQFTVKINKINELTLRKLRSFDDELAKKYSDVVLKIKNEKFHVLKHFLASHSSYFESLFFGNFEESKQSEVELKGINPQDFQNFLEIIHGETLINDNTVAGILHLADFFDSKTAIRRCLEFLLNRSEKPLKFKFHVATKYKLEELKKKCMAEMKTKDDVIGCTLENNEHFDNATWTELFTKLASFF